jgi:hypothetical protein
MADCNGAPDGKPPITNPVVENGCFVFRTTAEDQKRIQAWNWHCIALIERELWKKREGR